MIQAHLVCKCGKKFTRVTSKQELCKDCQIERDLKRRGKTYQEQIKREVEENG